MRRRRDKAGLTPADIMKLVGQSSDDAQLRAALAEHGLDELDAIQASAAALLESLREPQPKTKTEQGSEVLDQLRRLQ